MWISHSAMRAAMYHVTTMGCVCGIFVSMVGGFARVDGFAMVSRLAGFSGWMFCC